MALKTRKDLFGIQTRINTPQIYPASRLLSQVIGQAVPANKPIVGDNAFAHEAGIHQDGVLKHKLTYEIMKPQDVGIPSNKLGAGQTFGTSRLRRPADSVGSRPGDRGCQEGVRRVQGPVRQEESRLRRRYPGADHRGGPSRRRPFRAGQSRGDTLQPNRRRARWSRCG